MLVDPRRRALLSSCFQASCPPRTGERDGWSFTRKGVVSGLFSHEPIVARAPTGEFVVYLTHYPGDASSGPVCNCTDGSSASGGGSCAGEAGGGERKTLFSYFTSSMDPDGAGKHSWSKLTSLCGVQMSGGSNMPYNASNCLPNATGPSKPNTKGYSSTDLAMAFANVRAGTQKRRAVFGYPPEH